MNSIRLSFLFLLLCLATAVTSQKTNNTLRGKVLYQSSGNKPAAGVRVAEPDANPVYSVDNGDYILTFQQKRSGAALNLEVGKDDNKGQPLELVNEKEIKSAKLPADAQQILEIIVCPAGQRDIAAQKYYRILRTRADRELEKKKKEVDDLLAQKDKDYQRISNLFALVDRMQAALDSAKIREQAFNIASINLDRASQMVKDAVKKIDEGNDVEGALKILSAEALDTAYEHASVLKKQAEAAIRQVIEGYEFKISLLEPQFRYGEAAECCEKIAGIYEREGYAIENLAFYYSEAALFLNENGEYQNALEFALKALSIREKVLPTEHPDLATSYNNLALIFGNLGDYQKSLELNLKALDIREKDFKLERRYLVNSYNNIATTYHQLGDYKSALEFHIKALAIWEKDIHVDNPDLATSYNNIATTYGSLGDYQKELEFHIKALAIREKYLSIGHPHLAKSYSNIATAYYQLGDYMHAIEFHLKSLADSEKTLPANHPDLAAYYHNLAYTYGALGDYQKALESNLKSMAILERILPVDHPDLANSYINISTTYGRTGSFQDQLGYSLKALAINEKKLPPDHQYLATTYVTVASAYQNLGNYKKALEFLQKNLNIREKTLLPDHPEMGMSYNNIAIAYNKIGDYEKALSFQLKALAVVKNSLPDNHPDIATTYMNLAWTYSSLQRYKEALDFNLKGLAIFEEVLLPDHPSLAVAYSNVGRAYRDVGDYEKGIEYGQKSIHIGEAPSHQLPYLNLFYANIGITYVKARQYSEAKTALEKSENLNAEERVYRGWAMYYALQKNKKQALENLQKAVALGFKDLKWLEAEPDLKNIRKEKGYKELVEQLKKQ